MTKFKYTVVNNQNQQLTGTINAPNIKSARDELNHLGLSVISIEEITNTQETDSIATNEETFDFEAFDTTGRRILGRIKESNKEAAYARLKKEYNFDVVSLFPNTLSPKEKKTEKEKGINDIAINFQQNKESNPTLKENESITSDFELLQNTLQAKVESALQKVEEFLTQFAGEIKQKEEKSIREQMDKIKILKNSTNLNHIEGLTENLLNTIQKQKIFLHRDKFMKAKTSVSIEAKRMVSDLHKAPKRSIKPSNSKNASIITKIENKLNSFFKQDPEVLKIKEEIRATTINIFEYIKLYLKTSTPNEKEEIKNRMKSIYEKRKELKLKLKDAQNKYSQNLINNSSKDVFVNITEQLHGFTGWLLTFYLIYYFIGLYLTTKQIVYQSPPAGLAIYDTFILKYLLPIIFLAHIFLSLKRLFYPKNITLDIIGIPIVLLSSLLIIFNF